MKRKPAVAGCCSGLAVLMFLGASTLAQVPISPAPAALVPFGAKTVTPVSVTGIRSSESTESSAVQLRDNLPDAPSAVAQNAAQQEPTTAVAVPVEQSTRTPVRAPANTTVGPTFLIANGLLLGSTIANAEMIARCRPTACQAVPDAIRSRGALYGIGIPSSLAASYISYRLKRGGTRMWIVPVVVLTAGNIVYAAHAAQFSGSSSVVHSATRRP